MPDRIPDYTLFILPDGSFMCRECMRQEGVRPTLPGLMRYYPRRESLPVGCNQGWAATEKEGLLMANKGQELHYKNKRTDVYPNSRLTHKQVQEIKARYAKGKLLQSRLAEIYGVNKSTISRIVKGDTWGHHA
jgi:hypothetical protein